MARWSEFDYNIAHGEASTEAEGIGARLVHDGVEYTVSGCYSRMYQRKEVDGRFTTDLPTETVSLTVPGEQIPAVIPVEDYRLLSVAIGDEVFAVRYVTGTDFVTFTLKPMEEEIDPDAPSIVEDAIEQLEQDGVVR